MLSLLRSIRIVDSMRARAAVARRDAPWRRRGARNLFAFALLCAAQPAHASDLVHVQQGQLPVILTAPHGGRDEVPGCEVRTPVGTRFVTRTDLNTDRLALGIAEEIERITGRAPYLVMAKFHRRFIDANRRADEAYAGAACGPVYHFYHAAVRRFVDEARATYPHAMLFDLHGQAAYPDSILRGTVHGATVRSLLARAGSAALTGPRSVFGMFAGMGYSIVPTNDLPPTARVEAPNYAGGYTVATYGSSRPGGIDTMQLEFGIELRRKDVVARTATDAAHAIAGFYEQFLKAAAAAP